MESLNGTSAWLSSSMSVTFVDPTPTELFVLTDFLDSLQFPSMTQDEYYLQSGRTYAEDYMRFMHSDDVPKVVLERTLVRRSDYLFGGDLWVLLPRLSCSIDSFAN